ncbi:MAG TPA: imidazolonepropionase, partial [Chitinophagaceae bacterium]|nr:imidazolonepropionase [Chitinophagaceae bacterium]
MARTVIVNIKGLVNTRTEYKLLRGKDLAHLPVLTDAFLEIEDGLISRYGTMGTWKTDGFKPEEIFDAQGRFVLPSWCDSHTHLVFAAPREDEFVDKIKGLSYADIAAKGGGILNSAAKLNQMSETDLFNNAFRRLDEIRQTGTGAVEIKSGYGLTLDGELKMLRVIKKLRQQSDLSIRATFLGAHSYPQEFKDNHDGYIRLIVDEMLPVISKEKLADYIDV